MPLRCSKCSYPAPQSLTCPECGSAEFATPGAAAGRLWWPLFAGVLGVLVLRAGLFLVNGVRLRMCDPAPSWLRYAWQCTGEYIGYAGFRDYCAFLAFFFGGGALVIALASRQRRVFFSIVAGLLALQFIAAETVYDYQFITVRVGVTGTGSTPGQSIKMFQRP